MPHQTWKHRCKVSEHRLILLGVEVCPDCNEAGEYDGLGLTGIEAQGNFNKLTGLPSIGPHLRLLPKFYENCPACVGRSIIEPRKDGEWVSCKSCQGTGGIITVSERRFLEIQVDAWALFDKWRKDGADTVKSQEIDYQQRNRIYRHINRRDHYRPKPCKRISRYRARFDQLMSLTADPDSCTPELLAEWENLRPPKSNVDFTRGRTP